jgi:hypothetical protein
VRLESGDNTFACCPAFMPAMIRAKRENKQKPLCNGIQSQGATLKLRCSNGVRVGGSVAQLMVQTPHVLTISKQKIQAGLP